MGDCNPGKKCRRTMSLCVKTDYKARASGTYFALRRNALSKTGQQHIETIPQLFASTLFNLLQHHLNSFL
jgi:hypothetical protein